MKFSALFRLTVLIRIAAACSAEVRRIDLLARYGGEEFILILPGTGADEALRAVERIREKIEELKQPGIKRPVTISGGIYSGVPGRDDKLSQYLMKADKGLYQSLKKRPEQGLPL